MKIIISPAKKMRELDDGLPPQGTPLYLDRAQQLLDWMRTLSPQQAKRLWQCSDALAQQNYEQLQRTDLGRAFTPALLAFDGIAYVYMAPAVFDVQQLQYVQDHLRILSGFYGVLRPFDAVVPYRLEMQAKARVAGTQNLYEFWGDALYRQVVDDDRLVINLASVEYSKAVSAYLQPQERMVTCTFAQDVDGQLVQKGVWCKMARGQMVRYMAENRIEDPQQLRGFDSPDWRFSDELSDADTLVFLYCGSTRRKR